MEQLGLPAFQYRIQVLQAVIHVPQFWPPTIHLLFLFSSSGYFIIPSQFCPVRLSLLSWLIKIQSFRDQRHGLAVKPLSLCLQRRFLVLPLSVRLTADVLGKAGGDGPCTWPCAPMWETQMSSRRLASAWVSLSHCSHLETEAADGKSLSPF